MDVTVKPGEWARQREDEGWHVLSVADHFYTDHRPFPHVWVATTAIASATTRVKVTTSFVNNLLRSPIEVAQAALPTVHPSAALMVAFEAPRSQSRRRARSLRAR